MLSGHQFFRYSMQMRRRQRAVRMLVLTGAGYAAAIAIAMNILEFAVGKRASALILFRLFVFPQRPFRVFAKAVFLD
jgi:hypothetical protein